MKNFFTKNITIVVALFVGGSSCTYVAVQGWHAYLKRTERLEKSKQSKKITVEPGPVLKNDEKLEACYQNYLKKDPVHDEGIVRIHLTITPTGAIDQLDLVENELKDDEFTNCILTEIRTRHVPVTPERLASIINHKFSFKKRSPASINY